MWVLGVKDKKWLELVKKKPYAFGLESGFNDLTKINNEWIKLFLLSKQDITLQAHRRQLQDHLPIYRNGFNAYYLSKTKYYIYA